MERTRLGAGWWLGLLLLLGLIGAVVSACRPGLVGMMGDDSYYASYAQGLAATGTYVDRLGPVDAPAVRYAPGYPLLLAAFARLLPGLPVEIVFPTVSLASLLASLAIAAWLLVRALRMPPLLALGAVAVAGFHPMAAFHAGVAMSDLPAGAIAGLTLLALWRLEGRPGSLGALVAAAALASAGAWCRSAALILPLTGLLEPLRKRRWGVVAALGAGALAYLVPWSLWVAHARGGLTPQLGLFLQAGAREDRGADLLGACAEACFLVLPAMLLPAKVVPEWGNPLQAGLSGIVGCGMLVAIWRCGGRWPTLRWYMLGSLLLATAYASVFGGRVYLLGRYTLPLQPYVVGCVLEFIRLLVKDVWTLRHPDSLLQKKDYSFGWVLLLLVPLALFLELGAGRRLLAEIRGPVAEREGVVLRLGEWARRGLPPDALVATLVPGYVAMYVGRRPIDLYEAPFTPAGVVTLLRRHGRPGRTYLLDMMSLTYDNAPFRGMIAALEDANPGIFRPVVSVPSPSGLYPRIFLWRVTLPREVVLPRPAP